MTWREIRDRINQFSDEELDADAFVWLDDGVRDGMHKGRHLRGDNLIVGLGRLFEDLPMDDCANTISFELLDYRN